MAEKITFQRMTTRGAGWMQVKIEAGDQVINLCFDLQGKEPQDDLVRMILGAPAPRELTFSLVEKSFNTQRRDGFS